MSGKEIKALVIHLAPINGESSHHVSGVPLFLAHIDSLPPSADIGMPGLHNVGGIDKDVSINIGGIDPLPWCE